MPVTCFIVEPRLGRLSQADGDLIAKAIEDVIELNGIQAELVGRFIDRSCNEDKVYTSDGIIYKRT